MKVAVAVYDGVFDSGLSAVLDVLSNANALGGQLHESSPTWDVTLVGPGPRARTRAGLLVAPEPLELADTADLLVLPALGESDPSALIDHVGGEVSRPVRDLIVRTRARGTTIASACAGTFLLAEAGVLDGLRATTSWPLSPTFRDRYPEVELDHSRMVISCEGVITAGAAFGHVDLALTIVRAASPALADLVARHLVVDERPSQAAYTIPSALAQNDPTVAAFELWAREHLTEPIGIPVAARAIGVSERTLQRAVRRTVGTSPIRFVQDLRIERASHLLRTTDLSLETIARTVGYEHPNTLRVLLRERTGKTTSALRDSK
ncbi:GlxA family transcriptional regulator [Streptomyces sp. NPDC050548]|uniref:GlxA family transcriptional regulator n=1 Tax=Streptomyces sp. NPDC050548 TaxID=3365629 RepID=UPI003798B9E5